LAARRKRDSRQDHYTPPAPPVRQWYGGQVAVGLIAGVLLVCISWAIPRPIGDLYVGLAAGRDIVDTRLANLNQPDTWSFTATDRVWMNQNWGTHLGFYVAHVLGGETGLLVLKALMLLVMAGAIAACCRQRGAGWPMAMITAGAAVAAGRSFIDLRPNLTSLMIAPLMLAILYRTRTNRHFAWVALVLAAIWANVHGSFLFGLGMMGLWALCWLTVHALRNGIVPTLRTYWPLGVAVASAVVISGTLTPYGIGNITHPFVVGSSEKWRTIREWIPIHKPGFGTTWEFYVAMGLLIALPVVWFVTRVAFRPKRRLEIDADFVAALAFSVCLCVGLLAVALPWQAGKDYQTRRIIVIGTGLIAGIVGVLLGVSVITRSRAKTLRITPPSAGQLATIIFEVCLAAVVIVMAIKARRFIPLAIVLLGPMVALRAEWLFRAIGRGWLILPIAASLLVPATLAYHTLFRHYDSDNPFLPKHTVFQRMIGYQKFPPGPADFIDLNNISGRVLNEWRWEGYLRWRRPQLKLFVGGRAQQVYRLQTYETLMHIVSRGDPSGLTRSGVGLVIIPSSQKYARLIGAMVAKPHSTWAVVYADRRNVVVANAALPATRQLVDKAAAGRLKYPDAGTAALSRAMCLTAKCVRASRDSRISALLEANRLMPSVFAYRALEGTTGGAGMEPSRLIPYLQAESERLEAMPTNRSNGAQTLACRYAIAEALSRTFRKANNKRQALRWSAKASNIRDELEELKDQWN